MTNKKTLEELAAEQKKAERELKITKQKLRILEKEERELTHRERTHRLCTHGAMLEQYLNPEVFTDDQIEMILRSIFRWNEVTVLLNDIAKSAKPSEGPDTG